VERLPGGVALELVAISAGEFTMGSPRGEGYADERPQHAVHVTDHLLGRYPVTQAQWSAVMGESRPWRCPGPQRPADRVSWRDAAAFCARLTELTGRGYRLPSEAEWEYACRAGTTTPFAYGPGITTELANYQGEFTYGAAPKGIYRHVSTEVGAFPPNAWGMYDMHGNVWEWCADAWHASYVGAPADGSCWDVPGAWKRVLRGGCWHDPPDLCRSATRLAQNVADGEDYFGFRVALGTAEGSSCTR
jgi:formylglycine-generating enzyme required for sulfatase activity